MEFYKKELDTLKKKNILRQRKTYDEGIIDCASNDYLDLSCDKNLLTKAYEKLLHIKSHSPKASMLVNGYSLIHQEFEMKMADINGFESCISVGSGFLANIALIESLVRKGDRLFMDKEFHASGVLASRLVGGEVSVFGHNDYKHLEKLLQQDTSYRKIIAIEGVYSMSGDLCHREFFDIALKYDAILIIDEAHSSGVIGKQCLGVMDFYDIQPSNNYIKMGTLGKAYGSYGAYILASNEINSFLQNRAKSIIYSTAISLFDIALAYESVLYIQQNNDKIQTKVRDIQSIVNAKIQINKQALIFPVIVGDNKKVIDIQYSMQKKNILIGAIRTPTVDKAIIRLTPNIQHRDKIDSICSSLSETLNA